MAILSLFRLPNLVVILLTMVGARHILNSAFGKCPLNTSFWLLTLATMLTASAGNLLNDVFDRSMDAVNKPERVVIGKSISISSAIMLYAVLNLAALALGLRIPFGGYFPFWSLLLFPGVIVALFLYNWKIKCTPLLGNLVIALLCALVPFQLLWLYHFEQGQVTSEAPVALMIYVVFAFLLTLWREVVKDLEDLKGDRQAGCQTLPVVVGEKSTRWFARILGVMVVADLIYVVFTQFDGDQRFILLPVLVVPAIVANRWLWQEGHSVFYRKASLMIKLTMLAGLIALALPK